MTGSFALSIILFLSFSVMIRFVNYLMPQSAAASDLDISSGNSSKAISADLIEKIQAMPGVKVVYGRRSDFDVSAVWQGKTSYSDSLDLISYDDFDLKCLKTDGVLKSGSDLSKVYGDSRYVLATSDQDSPWKIGDHIQIGEESLEIAGLLKYDPFSSNGLTEGKMTLITSSETFVRLTGTTEYSLVMIQLTSDATDENVRAIQLAVGDEYSFHDQREQRTAGTYAAFVFCVYSFLAIIALVTVLNIINSLSMSVSARIKQYGAMRAVGMDERQLIKMIAVEAFTYAFWGCAAGVIVGLPLNKWLYEILITEHFPYALWHLPLTSLIVILLMVFFAAASAVYGPAKRIRSMAVTAAINEL